MGVEDEEASERAVVRGAILRRVSRFFGTCRRSTDDRDRARKSCEDLSRATRTTTGVKDATLYVVERLGGRFVDFDAENDGGLWRTSTTERKSTTLKRICHPPWGVVRTALAYVHNLLNVFSNVFANLQQRFAQVLEVRNLSEGRHPFSIKLKLSVCKLTSFQICELHLTHQLPLW